MSITQILESIAQDLERIVDAKADLKTSLEARGVVVPADMLIDGYAALINSLDTPSFLGLNCELISPGFYQKTYTLADTDFPNWTPSTTATAMVATEDANTFVASTGEYDYWIKWTADFTAAYLTGQTLKAVPRRQCHVIWQCIQRRASNLTNVNAGTDNYNYCTSAFTGSSMINYYNSSGTNTMGVGASYGFYAAATAATFSSTSSLTPTVTPKTPVLNARCSTTYFNTERAAYLDLDASTWKVRGDLYRVKKSSSSVWNFYNAAFDTFRNPL